MSRKNFGEVVSSAAAVALEPWVNDLYRARIPKFLAAHINPSKSNDWSQRAGIDRVIFLRSGHVLRIEEKFRFKEYPDILLERYDHAAKRTAGWVQRDLACDFLSYILVPSRKMFLFPFPLLRAAWLRHGQEWIRRYGIRKATTQGYFEEYETENVPVPIATISDAILAEMGFAKKGA